MMDLGNILECSVCLDQLGLDHKVLPCQHTFCISCLKDLIQRKKSSGGTFLCPECRSPCSLALEKLPANVILNRILEGIKNQTHPPPPSPPVKCDNNDKATPPRTTPVLPVKPPTRPPPPPPQTHVNAAAAAATNTTPNFIPGNLSTNPFLTPDVKTPDVVAAVTRPPIPPKLTANRLKNDNERGSPLSLAKVGTTTAGHQVFKALYDYTPVKGDELELKKDQSYVVVEKCKDGWFKGFSTGNLKSGFFPGNYVVKSQLNPSSSSSVNKNSKGAVDNFDDLIDFSNSSTNMTNEESSSSWSNVFRTTSTIVPPNVTTSWSSSSSTSNVPKGASSSSSSSNSIQNYSNDKDRYKCSMTYPASTKYELDLKEGDIVIIHRKREDGWCKGICEKSGKTGLFPFSFVTKI